MYSTDDGSNPEKGHDRTSEESTYEISITTRTCGSVSSQKNTNPALVINTDINLINSTVRTYEQTDIISPISNNRFSENTNEESVYNIVFS